MNGLSTPLRNGPRQLPKGGNRRSRLADVPSGRAAPQPFLRRSAPSGGTWCSRARSTPRRCARPCRERCHDEIGRPRHPLPRPRDLDRPAAALTRARPLLERAARDGTHLRCYSNPSNRSRKPPTGALPAPRQETSSRVSSFTQKIASCRNSPPSSTPVTRSTSTAHPGSA